MNSDFCVRVCERGDLSLLIDFAKRMATCGGAFLPCEESVFLSKYRPRDDNTQHLNFFVLWCKDEIIGCSGYIPFKGMLTAAPLTGFIAEDAFIDPVYRNRFPGLVPFLARSYEKMIRQEKFFPLICPATKARSRDFESVQWREFTSIYKFSTSHTAQIASNITLPSIEVRVINFFENDLKRFYTRISVQHPFLLCADTDFLNWRYCAENSGTYVILLATKGSEVVGYIILEQQDDDIYIIDITVDLDYPHVIALLVSKGLSQCKRQQVALTMCYVSHARYIEILEKMGFVMGYEFKCLFFKIALLWCRQIKQSEFYSLDKTLYHFNGFVPHLY